MTSQLYDIPLDRIDGHETTLKEHAGKVLLLVNVASKCGLTPQYAGLQGLQEKYRDQGFSVLGFPANNFAEQEPGSNEEIKTFCETTYHVDFPVYSKLSVTGEDQHPLYAHLTAAMPDTENRESMEKMLRGYKIEPNPEPEVVWNFEKFLVDRNGKVVQRFSPDMAPDADGVVEAIESALKHN